MNKKPRTLILTGYGLNCEEETKFAFETAGSTAHIVHVNDFIDSPDRLLSYRILAIPGGFSYGDDTGSGNAFAYKLRNHAWESLLKFISGDRLVIGICNGCQILANLGFIPGLGGTYGNRQVALLPNDSVRYTVRWTDLEIQNDSPWLKGIVRVSLPIAHGEGKFYAPPEIVKKLRGDRLVAMRYVRGEIAVNQYLPSNPTGTVDDIAAISDPTGRILGIMPHPERAIYFTQLPHWVFLKEQYLRKGRNIPVRGPGLKIFENAVRYFK